MRAVAHFFLYLFAALGAFFLIVVLGAVVDVLGQPQQIGEAGKGCVVGADEWRA